MIGLRNKITTAIVLVVLFVGLTITFTINRILPEALRNEAEQNGIYMARHLAKQSLEAISENDRVNLKKFINDEISFEKDVSYIFISDSKGDILASSLSGDLSLELIHANKTNNDETSNIKRVETSGGFVYDVAYPITSSNRRIGTVRIGFSEKSIQKTINHTLGIVLGITGIAIILSIFIGSGLANLIVKPVYLLRRATENLTKGNLDAEVNIKTGDEIEDLARSFNEMTSRLKESYNQLLKINRDLEKANKTKSEFLAMMSHELRTPLTAVIGFAELLTEDVMGKLNEVQKDSLNEILYNASDLLDLINGLLDLSRIESGNIELDIRTFNFTETLKNIYRTMSHIVMKKEINLQIDIPEKSIEIEGDELKIKQTLLNLLVNANKFTPERGNISLRTDTFDSWDEFCEIIPAKQVDKIEKTVFRKGGIEIVVEDTGVGIPKDQYENIFGMFFQVDRSSTRSYGGIGMGLALAKEFVRLHGGHIWVESEVAKGAKFTVILPYSTCR